MIKTIETYPWILEVADERFDKGFAITKMIQKAAEALQVAMSPHVVCKEQSVTSDGNTATINMSLTLQKDIDAKSVPIITNLATGQLAWK